jgi:hypothetical protein
MFFVPSFSEPETAASAYNFHTPSCKCTKRARFPSLPMERNALLTASSTGSWLEWLILVSFSFSFFGKECANCEKEDE